MKEKLLIGILGGEQSGKTHTWDCLFGHNVKTGKNMRRLYLSGEDYVNVFLISRSPSKRKMSVKDILKSKTPEVVLCSLQYTPEVLNTLKHFHNNGYKLYIQWLNPGFSEENDDPLFYDNTIINQLMHWHALVSVRNGKKDPSNRIDEIRYYLYGWAKLQGHIIRKGDKKHKEQP